MAAAVNSEPCLEPQAMLLSSAPGRKEALIGGGGQVWRGLPLWRGKGGAIPSWGGVRGAAETPTGVGDPEDTGVCQ